MSARRANDPGPRTARNPKLVVGLSEVAALLGASKSNARKMLDGHGIAPVDDLAVGPVWLLRRPTPRELDRLVPETIEELKQRREQDVKARLADERRRETWARKREGAR